MSGKEALKQRFAGLAGTIPLTVLVPLTMTLFIGLVGLLGYVGHRRAVEEELEREGARDLELDLVRLRAALEEAARRQDTVWMQEQLIAFGADSHGILAVLVDQDNVVAASAIRTQVGQDIRAVIPVSLRGSALYDDAMLERVRATMTGQVTSDKRRNLVAGLYPVFIGSHEGDPEPEEMGLVLLARDLSELKWQALRSARRQTGQMGLLLVALAVLASFLLHQMFTRRLARIARAADRLAAGDFTAQTGVVGSDEIALLGRSLDAMVADIRKHQAALEESEERHRTLFQNAVEGVITMGEDRRIQEVNPAAEAMFGYSQEELVGENVSVLMPSPYREEHDGYVKGYLETGKRKIIGIGREVMGRRKDGTVFPLDLSVAELRLTNERLFTGIVRDITDRKRSEQALQKLNEQLEDLVKERTQALEDAQEALVRKERLATLGQLAGSVAHEIRNPLGIVRNAAYYLEQTSENADDEILDSHDEIRRGLTRADRIITELLDYARDPRSHPRPFELGAVIREAFEGVEISPSITVDRSSVNPSPTCYGDPDQIGRVINNLIINATQAMSDGGGALTVRCLRGEEDTVIVEVRDTGVGMTEEQLSRVFEPLFTTKTRGIGLGLALSVRYAEMNRATISAESVPGEGSIFRVVLPLHGESEHPEGCESPIDA